MVVKFPEELNKMEERFEPYLDTESVDIKFKEGTPQEIIDLYNEWKAKADELFVI